MYFIKALSYVEDAPAARKRWLVEAQEHTSQKYFPKDYEDLRRLTQEFGEYRTPMIVPCLFEDYDWDNTEYTVFVIVTVHKPNGTWINYLLGDARIFIMNNDGATIDTIRV